MADTRAAERTVLVGYALSMLGMLFLAYAAYEIPQTLVRSAREVAAAERVLSTIGDIGRSALDAESTARSYIITGDPPTLQRYIRLLPEIDQQIASFRRITEGQPEQQARATRLEAQMNARFAFLTSVVRARESEGFEAARRMATTGAGRAGMNVIRATLASMEDDVSRAAQARRAEEENTTGLLYALVAAIVVVGATILAWISLQTRRALRMQHDAQQRVQHLAHHDALTALPNRRLLHDRIAQMIASASRKQARFAILFLDLDGFKQVNDTFGHDGGDELLVQVADRLRRIVRAEDTVARLGGDEFVVGLRVITGTQDAALVADKVLASLSAPCIVGNGEAQVSASIGIAFYPTDADTPDLLLKAADDALYRAKRAGKSRYEFAGGSELPVTAP